MNQTHLLDVRRVKQGSAVRSWILHSVMVMSLVAAGASARAAAGEFTESKSFNVSIPIPDNSPSGIVVSRNLSFNVTNITGLTVDLSIFGNFNGDLFGFLSHGSGFSVLLNRVGRSPGNDFGYNDGGFNIRLDDAAANGDIHNYRLALTGSQTTPVDGPVTGLFAPDGRTTDPSAVEDTDPRTALLKAFNGLDPNGTWTLFLADVSPGGNSTLTGFGLNVTGVPEPSTWAMLLLGGAAVIGRSVFSRRQASGKI